jgi:hypothetical protein
VPKLNRLAGMEYLPGDPPERFDDDYAFLGNCRAMPAHRDTA